MMSTFHLNRQHTSPQNCQAPRTRSRVECLATSVGQWISPAYPSIAERVSDGRTAFSKMAEPQPQHGGVDRDHRPGRYASNRSALFG